ncbi:hypothetical protein AAFG13_35710 [Bradyrhizobium sp. B124]|uniref:hypothetical protein n=1 Tax=Bradyrhizobium sp. B124 TaxID=3140245 RepID=UPI0031832EB6
MSRAAFFVPENGPQFALFCVGFVLFPTCERRDVCTPPYLQRLHVVRGAPASTGSAGKRFAGSFDTMKDLH